jgi:hypothetical protein
MAQCRSRREVSVTLLTLFLFVLVFSSWQFLYAAYSGAPCPRRTGFSAVRAGWARPISEGVRKFFLFILFIFSVCSFLFLVFVFCIYFIYIIILMISKIQELFRNKKCSKYEYIRNLKMFKM